MGPHLVWIELQGRMQELLAANPPCPGRCNSLHPRRKQPERNHRQKQQCPDADPASIKPSLQGTAPQYPPGEKPQNICCRVRDHEPAKPVWQLHILCVPPDVGSPSPPQDPAAGNPVIGESFLQQNLQRIATAVLSYPGMQQQAFNFRQYRRLLPSEKKIAKNIAIQPHFLQVAAHHDQRLANQTNNNDEGRLGRVCYAKDQRSRFLYRIAEITVWKIFLFGFEARLLGHEINPTSNGSRIRKRRQSSICHRLARRG
ncbi:MAG TPA: hypothetical protein VGJ30_13385 [Candidatus Angelobacter sp.]